MDVRFGVVLCDVGDGKVGEVCDGLGRLSRGPSFGAGECGAGGSYSASRVRRFGGSASGRGWCLRPRRFRSRHLFVGACAM